MAVSDRIAVMNLGEIQHIGTPKDIYQRPANLFVATFIGQSDIFEGEIVTDNGKKLVKLFDGSLLERVDSFFDGFMNIIR